MSQQTWFVVRGGKEEGPYSGTALKDMATSGKLKPTDLVRRGDVETARPAGHIKGLFPAGDGVGVASTPKPPADRDTAPAPAVRKPLVIVATVAGALVLLCGGVGVLVTVFNREKQAAQKELAEADGLWTSGDKAGAAAKYRALLQNKSRKAAVKDELAPVYGRLIDYEIEQGRKDAAKALLDEATAAKVTPSVNHPEAKALLSAGPQWVAKKNGSNDGPPVPQGDVLTADYLPCIAGNVKRYEEERYDFDTGKPVNRTTNKITFHGDNKLTTEWSTVSPGQRPTSGKGPETLVEKDGMIDWLGRITIKVGARAGDEWPSPRGNFSYKLVRFEKAKAQGGGGKEIELHRAIIESRIVSDDGQGGKMEHRTEYVLERGGGIQTEKEYMTAKGKKVLIRDRRLLSSTY